MQLIGGEAGQLSPRDGMNLLMFVTGRLVTHIYPTTISEPPPISIYENCAHELETWMKMIRPEFAGLLRNAADTLPSWNVQLVSLSTDPHVQCYCPHMQHNPMDSSLRSALPAIGRSSSLLSALFVQQPSYYLLLTKAIALKYRALATYYHTGMVVYRPALEQLVLRVVGIINDDGNGSFNPTAISQYAERW